MKKAIVFAALALFVPALCIAQPPAKSDMAKGKCPFLQEKSAEKEVAGKGMCAMESKGSVCDKKTTGSCCRKTGGCGSGIASTDKGGVIVLRGNHLYKYDNNLNLVKKIEIGGNEGPEG